MTIVRLLFCPFFILVFSLLLGACSEKDSQQYKSEMILVSAGEFIMGSNKVDKEAKDYGFIQPLYVDEHPQRKIFQDAFWIDKYEVTNGEFALFFEATEGNIAKAIVGKQKREIPGWSRLSVNQVSWFQAQKYCVWVGKRLPSETEWEKAARGPNGLEYPWGNEWDPKKLNQGLGDSETGVAPVGAYASGQSFYGVHDLAGNVAEWVADWYHMYPGAAYKSQFSGQTHKVVRGGGWGGIGHYVIPALFRTSHRDYEKPGRAFNDIGFRCARNTDQRSAD